MRVHPTHIHTYIFCNWRNYAPQQLSILPSTNEFCLSVYSGVAFFYKQVPGKRVNARNISLLSTSTHFRVDQPMEASPSLPERKLSGSSGIRTNQAQAQQQQPAQRRQYTTEANQELAQLFECPVCFDYVLPPIMQCNSGHLVCQNCQPKLTVSNRCTNHAKNNETSTVQRAAARRQRFAIWQWRRWRQRSTFRVNTTRVDVTSRFCMIRRRRMRVPILGVFLSLYVNFRNVRIPSVSLPLPRRQLQVAGQFRRGDGSLAQCSQGLNCRICLCNLHSTFKDDHDAPGWRHCLLGHRCHIAGRRWLGDDAELLWQSFYARARKAGKVWRSCPILCRFVFCTSVLR